MSGALDGQVAVVTGAARGIGRACALRLAGLGADVAIADLNLDSAKEFDERLSADSVEEEIRALGRRTLGVTTDVRRQSEVDDLFARLDETFGPVDIVVNAAGGSLSPMERSYASSMPADDLRWMLELNLLGTIYCCQAAAGRMKARRSGRIVNFSSNTGVRVNPEWAGMLSGYSVAKAGVVQYTRSLAAELGPFGIRVNCIAPHVIRTARTGQRFNLDDPAEAEKQSAMLPLRRLGTPEDVAKVMEFLVTDLSGYVTGQTVSVCGGATLSPS